MNFALIGCSHPHSRAHLRTLQLLPEVGSIALWDGHLPAAESVAAARPEKVSEVTSDLDRLLGREDIEYVLVTVPNNESPEVIARCARAGKHILAEKPLAVSAEALRPALAAVRAAGVTLGVCYQNRRHPVVADVRRLLAERALGRPLTIEVRMVTSQVRFRDPTHWLFRKEIAGGGILSWLGCHYVDLVRYALGQEIVEVAALTGTLSGEAIEVEDAACFSFRTAEGVLGTFHAGYLLAGSVPGYSGASYDTYIAMKGTEGGLRWQPHARPPLLQVETLSGPLGAAPERTLSYALATSEAYGGVYGEQFVRDFITAAQTGGEPPASGEDGLKVLRILDAVYRSAETGRVVAVEA
ncbi:MAG: Gfo/Idh/MocA family oxidoreductase [Armatimonadetes bacterium]|nr:Gfo/Idh/MocA family oxidoreductase [Armatimonadota bacterium]